MPEKEHEYILNRNKNKQDVENNFKDQLLLLNDIVNYGTNLIQSAYVSSDRGLSSIIIIGVLLKQVVSMLDAIETLVANSQIHAAHLQARAAYEASIYIDWMLKEKTDDKARHYYVSNLRNDRRWALRTIEGTAEAKDFSKVIDQLHIDLKSKNPSIEDEAKKQISEVNRILSQNGFREIDEKFERLKSRNRRNLEPQWYKPLNINSIRQIAKEVNRLPEYDMFYSIGSTVTHCASYRDHIRFKNNTISFKPIRLLGEIDSLLKSSISIVLQSYRSIIGFYIPGSMNNFDRKYVSDWRAAYLGIKSVRYNISDSEPI